MASSLPRRAAHAALVICAAPIWFMAYMALVICTWLVLAADRVMPHARVGNCWSYVGPRFVKHGGYIGIRVARGVSIFRLLLVPHAIWIRELPETADIRQTVPLHRRRGRWMPWFVAYFRFKVVDYEQRKADTDWAAFISKD